MQVDKQTLQRIAHLARLELDKGSEEEMLKSLSEILDWVDKLNEVDTENVEPLTNMSYELNNFREDKMGETLSREQALKNAPKHDEKFFLVPKVLK